ncbi:hypothetical protein [Streptomyces europaeiscabiei]|uniref:hypothetical protein n=1 Tax=Streptomyces europaeiscabiei TaxID=146819 RepID=UPI0029ADFDAF|nr:hypothetical protein [Streptomyces europaeiscabiei]MDX3860058.1 hypothetical protein [Streptomyces europaeiscabiei]
MAGVLPRGGNRSTNRVGPTVSRRLRAAGWNIGPATRRHSHRGVFVKTAGDFVSVLVDTGDASDNEQAANGIREAVEAWAEAGNVSVTEDDGVRWVRFTYRPQQP